MAKPERFLRPELLDNLPRSGRSMTESRFKENEVELMAEVLRFYDKPLPQAGSNFRSRDVSDPMLERIWVATLRFFKMLRLEQAPSPHISLEAYRTAILPLIIEKWEGIIKWLRLLHLYLSPIEPRVFNICCGILTRTIHAFHEEERAEELLCSPIAIDFVFHLVCEGDVHANGLFQEHYGGSLHTLFAGCVLSETGKQAFSERLLNLDRRTQQSIASALTSRAEAVVQNLQRQDHVKGWRDAQDDLYYLVNCVHSLAQATPALWGLFRRHRFIYEYTNAVCTLAQQASSRDDTDQSVWIRVANFLVFIMADVIESICVLRHDAIAEAVEGGWLVGAYAAALKLDNKSPYPTLESGLDNCIRSVCHYSLPVYKAVMAVGETHPMQEWLDSQTITDPKTAPLWHPFITMYNRSLDVFRDGDLDSFVDLCQNSTCIDSRDIHRKSDPESSLRACSGCRSVYYCSKICQKGNWKRFHKVECPDLRRGYEQQKFNRTWIPSSIRLDYLLHLNYILNHINAIEYNDWKQDDVLILDTYHFVGVGEIALPMETCRRTIWESNDLDWSPRLAGFLEDMKADTSLRLAQGIFFHHSDHTQALVILAKVRWALVPSSPSHGLKRYTVLSCVFRLCKNDAIEKFWNENNGVILEAIPAE